MDSRFQVLDAGFFLSGTLIRDSNHKSDPDSLSCEAQDSEFHKKKFPNSGYHKALISENFQDSAIHIPLHEAKEFTHVLTFLYRELKFNKMKIQGGIGNYNGVDSMKTMDNEMIIRTNILHQV